MDLNGSKPSPKEVVHALATFLREETREIQTRNGLTRQQTYIIFKCPNDLCKDRSGEMHFEKNSGFINPFRHLKACVAGGDLTNLYRLYNENIKEKEITTTCTDVKSFLLKEAPKEVALYDYIRLIVCKSFPISLVESAGCRSLSKHAYRFSMSYICQVVMQLTKLVEREIATELKAAECGAILYGSGTLGGVRYTCLFASYNRKIMRTQNGSQEDEVTELTLLSCAPMASVNLDGNDCGNAKSTFDEETVSSSASIYAGHIKEMFKTYGIDVCGWAVCQTVLNCRVTRKVSSLLGISHVACKSYLLNAEVDDMFSKADELAGTLECVNDTMAKCKLILRNVALLPNIGELRPVPLVLRNQTEWIAKYHMLARFLRFRQQLLQLSEDTMYDCSTNCRFAFRDKVQRYCNHLRQINETKEYLQTRKLPLFGCQNALEMLIEEVDTGCEDRYSPFYRCCLKKHYLAPDADVLHHPLFESGVCKLQSGRSEEMSDEERSACQCLRLTSRDSSTESKPVQGQEEVTYEERLERRKRRKTFKGGYRNCDFIMGSTAELERLWSIADSILCDDSMTPLLLESILFLRLNERFWDIQLVRKASRYSGKGPTSEV